MALQVLHVMEAFRSKRMFRPGFATFALAYIMQKMRAGEHTRLDVAHTAHIIGEWRAGFRREGNDPLHPILGELVAVIEMRSAEYLKVDQFSARQIATVMWMFGRLTTPPESMELRNLLSSYICNHVRLRTCVASASPNLWRQLYSGRACSGVVGVVRGCGPRRRNRRLCSGGVALTPVCAAAAWPMQLTGHGEFRLLVCGDGVRSGTVDTGRDSKACE